MSKIKSRESAKGIKVLDRTTVASRRMKTALIRSKNQAVNLLDDDKISPSEYAESELQNTGKIGMNQMWQAASSCGRKAITKERQALQRRQLNAKASKTEQGFSGTTVGKSASSCKHPARHGNAIKSPKQVIKQAPHSVTRQAGKTSTKAATRTMGKTAKAAAQAGRKAVAVARSAVKAVAAGAKAVVSGSKAVVTAILAGGWIAVVAVIIICLVAMMATSCFGVFFSGEDTGSEQTMQEAVKEIDKEYQNRLQKIQESNIHDDMDITGFRAEWPEVLSVYAVKTTTDPDNPQEVATMTEDKKQILKETFWQMNRIAFRTESSTKEGNPYRILHITVSHKTGEQMATECGFSEGQREQLSELLANDKVDAWASLLLNTSSNNENTVSS